MKGIAIIIALAAAAVALMWTFPETPPQCTGGPVEHLFASAACP
ncbi:MULTISPECIES: hypothetical protein [unclassified Bradyrhizobium]|nr:MULTISPECIES: hypothetical protein [unclassified Bradyrhizobium]